MENNSIKLTLLVVLLVVATAGLRFGVEARDVQDDQTHYPNKGPIVRFPCEKSSDCGPGCTCKDTMCKCAAAPQLPAEIIARGPIVRFECETSSDCPGGCICKDTMCKC